MKYWLTSVGSSSPLIRLLIPSLRARCSKQPLNFLFPHLTLICLTSLPSSVLPTCCFLSSSHMLLPACYWWMFLHEAVNCWSTRPPHSHTHTTGTSSSLLTHIVRGRHQGARHAEVYTHTHTHTHTRVYLNVVYRRTFLFRTFMSRNIDLYYLSIHLHLTRLISAYNTDDTPPKEHKTTVRVVAFIILL